MPKFRRLPEEIEAVRFDPCGAHRLELPKGVRKAAFTDEQERIVWQYCVTTIQGVQTPITSGEWVMPEPDFVHFYPCADRGDGLAPLRHEPASEGETLGNYWLSSEGRKELRIAAAKEAIDAFLYGVPVLLDALSFYEDRVAPLKCEPVEENANPPANNRIYIDANKLEHLLNCMAQLDFLPMSGRHADEPIIRAAYSEAREILHNANPAGSDPQGPIKGVTLS